MDRIVLMTPMDVPLVTVDDILGTAIRLQEKTGCRARKDGLAVSFVGGPLNGQQARLPNEPTNLLIFFQDEMNVRRGYELRQIDGEWCFAYQPNVRRHRGRH